MFLSPFDQNREKPTDAWCPAPRAGIQFVSLMKFASVLSLICGVTFDGVETETAMH